MNQMSLKNWFIPLGMKCPLCGSDNLVCRRYFERPGELKVICWRCDQSKWVVDHRAETKV